jgi:hypothetical protein
MDRINIVVCSRPPIFKAEKLLGSEHYLILPGSANRQQRETVEAAACNTTINPVQGATAVVNYEANPVPETNSGAFRSAQSDRPVYLDIFYTTRWNR